MVPRISLALTELSECLCAALSERGSGPTCWCGVWHGQEVPWDFCSPCDGDACGMGWVRIAAAGPSDNFPNFTLDPNCRKPLAYQVELGVVRCYPVMENDGSLPSVEDIYVDAMGMLADMEAIRYAMSCCGSEYITELALEAYTPLGPSGACAGGIWTAWIAVE